MPTLPVPLAAFRTHLNLRPEQGDDVELTRHLAGATSTIETLCGLLAPREVVELHHNSGNGWIYLRAWPVIEVLSILDVDQVDMGLPVPPTSTGVYLVSGGAVGLSTWTFTAGRIEIDPELEDPASFTDLQLAVLDLARHLYGPQRRSPAPGSRSTQGAGETTVRGFLLPNSVAAGINPHLKGSNP